MSDYWTGEKARQYARESWGLKIDRWMSVDFDADMGYVRIRGDRKSHYPAVFRTDTSLERSGILLDRGLNDELIGIELFLHQGQLRDVTCSELVRLLRAEKGDAT